MQVQSLSPATFLLQKYILSMFRKYSMRPKEWEIPLPDGFKILVWKRKFLGKWLDFGVVLIFEGECVTRYDAAHGTPHRDVLGKKSGLIRKEKCSTIALKEAFDHAIRDLTKNFRTYFEFYIDR